MIKRVKDGLINKKENILEDNIGYVEHWDFSKANMSNENRINAITLVASICYQNPKALGSESLYNRLMAESHGLPSSSFEYVPMLFSQKEITSLYCTRKLLVSDNNPLTKFGEWIEDGEYLLTNFRAVVYLFEKFGIDFRDKFNTEAECSIIAKHFKVFKYYVDLPTRAQMVRHRINWQELSRRYVSGKRVPFDFYVSEKMKDVTSEAGDTQKILDICLEHYYKALEDGVKPQEARRIIPQAGYSQIWGGFQPTQLENYFKLRLDSHAQWEIRKTAEAMKELIEK